MGVCVRAWMETQGEKREPQELWSSDPVLEMKKGVVLHRRIER